MLHYIYHTIEEPGSHATPVWCVVRIDRISSQWQSFLVFLHMAT